MTMQKAEVNEVDTYIAGFPEATQQLLKQLRATILKAAPDAKESISYKVPVYTCFGPLAYFAAYKNHIGFYPIPSGIEAFKGELINYKCAKGSVQFPIDQPLPLELIAKMVAFRVKENMQKAKDKKSRKV